MIQAELGLSKEDLEEAKLALLRAGEYGETPKSQAEINLANARIKDFLASSEYNKARARDVGSLRDLERQKLEGEYIAALRLGDQRAAAAAYDNLRREYYPSESQATQERERSQAEYNRARERNVGAAERGTQSRFEAGRTTVQMPNGDIVMVEPKDLPDILAGGGKALTPYQRSQLERQNRKDIREESEDERKKRERVQENETNILANPSAVQIVPTIDAFNEENPKDYVYIHKKSGLGIASPRPVRVNLAGPDKRPLSGEVVTAAWKKYQRDNNSSISLEEYIDLKGLRRK